MKATLFHQPEAGEAPWPADRLRRALDRAGIEASYCSTNEEGWRACLGAARDAVIAAGGDGTIARVATRLVDRRVPMAILPMGSANNIARSLGVFGEVEALIAGLADASETVLPIAEARGRWGVRRFVEAVGLGAIARTTNALQDASLDGDEKRNAGRDTLVRTVETMAPVRATVALDGEPLHGEALVVEVMNIPMIGPNLHLGPERMAQDGTLCVAWLPVGDRDAMAAWIRAPEGRGPAPLRHRTARCVTLDAHDEPLRIDDKTVEWDGSRMTFSLEGPPVRVLVPRGAR